MTFGAYIRQERGRQHRRLIDLAADVGISAQYLSDIEQGRRNRPAKALIAVFADALGIDADYLYFLAGWLPPDVLSDVPRDVVVAAFAAFRRELG